MLFVAKDDNRSLHFYQSNLILQFLEATSCFLPWSVDTRQVSQVSFSPHLTPLPHTHHPLLYPSFRRSDHFKCWQSTHGKLYIFILWYVPNNKAVPLVMWTNNIQEEPVTCRNLAPQSFRSLDMTYATNLHLDLETNVFLAHILSTRIMFWPF